MQNFEMIKKRFLSADTMEKIDIYTSAEGLTKEQFLVLLRLFPRTELPLLEAALRG